MVANKEGDRFTSGFNAEVFYLSAKEQFLFPKMQLVKKEYSDKNRALLLFYSLKIAGLLFPDNFIQVGALVSRSTPQGELCLLYSKMADVYPEHAVYCAHVSFKGSGKVNCCECEACRSHRKVHEFFWHRGKAEWAANKFKKAGIIVPRGDPTDYCFDKEGRVVFFELDGILPEKVIQFLSTHREAGILGRTKRKARRLTERLKKISGNGDYINLVRELRISSEGLLAEFFSG